MAFRKTFDELLSQILTDWRNQFPSADASQGSLLFLRSACLASALWGAYEHQEWVSRQAQPDTADTEALEHHGWVRGVERLAGETDAALLERLLAKLRKPPAGGNRYDYVAWAREVQGVRSAYCYPLGQGLGTVDVVVVADAATEGSEIPDAELLAATKAHIDEVRPTTASLVRCLAPTLVVQDVTMTVTGPADVTVIAAEIEAYLSSFIPLQPLYLGQLIAIAIDNGAIDAVVSVPAASVVPTGYEMLRPGAMEVTSA